MKQRPPCPFYGFSLLERGRCLVDSRGNECGMSPGHPCKYKIKEQDPNWDYCFFNNEDNSELIKRLSKEFVVIPREFNTSISFNEWIRYIMSTKH